MPAQVIFQGQREPFIVPDYESAKSMVKRAFPEVFFGQLKAQASCVSQRAWVSTLDAIAETPCVALLRRTISDTERRAKAAAVHLERLGQSLGIQPESIIHPFYECWWEPTDTGVEIVDCDGHQLLELREGCAICELLPEAERRVCRLSGLADSRPPSFCREFLLALAEIDRSANDSCCFAGGAR